MPRASFEQLSAFVAVAEQGSFSKAARLLRKDRSTLHHQVSDLEIDWNVVLFERSGKAPVLTDDGKALLRPAKFIIYQMNSLEKATEGLHLGDKASLTICYDASIPSSAIAEFDRHIVERHPTTGINWLQRDRNQALSLLGEAAADFAITLNQGMVHPDSGMSFVNLGYPRFAFYVHQSSPLATQARVSMAELQLHRQYTLEAFENTPIGSQSAISPRLHKVSDSYLLASLLARGGFALLPRHLVITLPCQLAPLDVDFAAQHGHFGYVLQYPSNAALPPLQQFVVETVVSWFKQICS
ncbi:LysR family transcriptional regulator [Aliagarivorans marinus]|uniref:LysR family transcriptional regulator n=1 Tax=Aliagarivorans marinus TaxID=561965 RepID=UPI0004183BE1|nr:LysR family transcriptional regulator [Aliagarivorans marinus]